MSKLTSQQYAELANDAYRNATPGTEVTYGGVTFQVREHVNNNGPGQSGYAGTIYQRTDTGEMVVAHRGTEFQPNRNGFQDLVLADGGMVVNRRTNGQGDQAVALTERAIALAGGDASKVTVTGHSLGGTLAQISAAETGVRGETFNAYGAVGLERRNIPEGGTSVVNHVMSADAVSAASRHYGEVRTYATTQEIGRMQDPVIGGYSNNPTPLIGSLNDRPLVVAGRTAGSHSMHNFLPVDGKGNPDRSVLGDPRATELARENATSISTYRGDIQSIHGFVRAGGDLNRYITNPGQLIEDIRNRFGAVEPANNGPTPANPGATPPTRFAAAEGNSTSNLLDGLLRGDRDALQTAANQPAGRELGQAAVASVNRVEEQLAAERLAAVELQRMNNPTVASPSARTV
jgi:hypothetical protein